MTGVIWLVFVVVLGRRVGHARGVHQAEPQAVRAGLREGPVRAAGCVGDVGVWQAAQRPQDGCQGRRERHGAIAGAVLERARDGTDLIVDVPVNADAAQIPVDVPPAQAAGFARAAAEIVQQGEVVPVRVGAAGVLQSGALLRRQDQLFGGGLRLRAHKAERWVSADEPVRQRGAKHTAERGDYVSNFALAPPGVSVHQLLQLHGGDRSEMVLPEDREQVLIEGGAVALARAGRYERGFADAIPLRGIVAEQPVVAEGLAGDVAGDHGLTGLSQFRAGAALDPLVDGLAVRVHADLDLGAIRRFLFRHKNTSFACAEREDVLYYEYPPLTWSFGVRCPCPDGARTGAIFIMS